MTGEVTLEFKYPIALVIINHPDAVHALRELGRPYEGHRPTNSEYPDWMAQNPEVRLAEFRETVNGPAILAFLGPGAFHLYERVGSVVPNDSRHAPVGKVQTFQIPRDELEHRAIDQLMARGEFTLRSALDAQTLSLTARPLAF